MDKSKLIPHRPKLERAEIWFAGDGCFAQYWDSWPGKNDKGESMLFVVMRPFEKLIRKWNVPDDALDEDFCLRPIPYPASKCHWIDFSPYGSTLLVQTDFMGGTGLFDSLFIKKDEYIKTLEIMNETLIERNALLEEDMRSAATKFDEELERTSKRVETAGKRMRPTIITTKDGGVSTMQTHRPEEQI